MQADEPILANGEKAADEQSAKDTLSSVGSKRKLADDKDDAEDSGGEGRGSGKEEHANGESVDVEGKAEIVGENEGRARKKSRTTNAEAKATSDDGEE